MEEVGDALEARAGVDRGAFEFADEFEIVAFAFAPDEFVEDEVPDFQEAVSLGVCGGAAVRAVLGAAVVVDLAACPCRSGLAGGPRDLFEREFLNVIGGKADDASPVVVGNRVFFPDRHPQAVAVEPVASVGNRGGQEAPREVDGAFFEVVAEGEVAVHLEERAVARGSADVVDVVRSDALLNGCDRRPRGGLGVQDVGDEWHHSRDGEEDRGIGRNEGHRGRDVVIVLGEVVEPALADFGGTHF